MKSRDDRKTADFWSLALEGIRDEGVAKRDNVTKWDVVLHSLCMAVLRGERIFADFRGLAEPGSGFNVAEPSRLRTGDTKIRDVPAIRIT